MEEDEDVTMAGPGEVTTPEQEFKVDDGQATSHVAAEEKDGWKSTDLAAGEGDLSQPRDVKRA